MNRFHIIGRLAVIAGGLGGALLGLSAGNSVALSGTTVVAGAPFNNANAGAAYVFRKV
jgi:hypothetical protein